MKIPSSSSICLLGALAGLAAADCWDNKCSILGLSATVSCGSACRDAGYGSSGYELYTKGFLGVESWIVCTCGTWHSDDCGTCRNRGTPCKSRDDESDEFFDGKVPECG